MLFGLFRIALIAAAVYAVWRVFLHLYPLTDAGGHLIWGHAFGGFVLGLLTVFALARAWLRS